MTNESENYPCDLPPFFPPSLNIPVSINYIQVSIALVLGITGFLLNLFILLMVVSYKILHQRLMYLALQIVCIDLVYTLTIPPVIFASGVSGVWLLGEVMCNILGIVHDFFAMFRFTTTLILTLDRFISVFWPFFYIRKSHQLILALVALMYVVSTLRGLLPVSGILGCHVYIPTQKTCTAFSGCSAGCFWFVVGGTSVVIIFGALIPLLLYIVLFCKVRAIKKKSAQYLPSLGTDGGNTSNPVVVPSSATRSEGKNSISSLGSFEGSVPAKYASKLIHTNAGLGTELHSVPTTNGCFKPPIGTEFEPSKTIDVDVGPNVNRSANNELKDSSMSEPPNRDNNCIRVERGTPLALQVSNGTSNRDAASPSKAGFKAESINRSPVFHNDSLSPTEKEFRVEGTNTSPGAPESLSPTEKEQPKKKTRMDRSHVRANVTMFILLMSVIGCTAPAFVLYGIQFFYLKPEPILFIVNMLVGRTFFYLLPVVDSFAIMRHQEFRVASKRLLKSIKQKLH